MQEISRLNNLIEEIDLELMVMDCTRGKYRELMENRERYEATKHQLIRDFHVSND